MLFPSTSAATTLIWSALASLFILSIMLEQTKIVKHFVHFLLAKCVRVTLPSFVEMVSSSVLIDRFSQYPVDKK
jgi:hypothetical protein